MVADAINRSISIRLARPELDAIRTAILDDQTSTPELGMEFCKADQGDWRIYLCTTDRTDHCGISSVPAGITLCRGDFRQGIAEWRDRVEAIVTLGNRIEILIGPASDDGFEFVAIVHDANGWKFADHAFLEEAPASRVWAGGSPPKTPNLPPERVARFTSSFGVEAWQRLRRSTAVVIGAGGTGSVTIPMLARAGVGRIVIVDSDHITPSNLERTHASFPEHVEAQTLKAELARDHVRAIDPDIDVVAYAGRLPQPEIVAEIAKADVIVGCTDQHTSRLAVADMARRYLVPAIDCGGLIEGADGRVTGQIIQLVVFRPDDPCPICRGMIDPVRVSQELVSPEERAAIKRAAGEGSVPPEAHEIPQIDTVGYITTVSGTLAAGYAIGWLTGRFDPPFERMQMNLVADCLDVTNRPQKHDPQCNCRSSRGSGDAGRALAPFAVPDHWQPARQIL